MKKILYLSFLVGLFHVKLNAQIGIGTNAPQAALDINSKGNDASTKALRIINGSNQEKLTILDNGNLGIDQINPTEKLDVNGNIKLTGNLVTNGNKGNEKEVLISNGTDKSLWADSKLLPGSVYKSYYTQQKSKIIVQIGETHELSELSFTHTVPENTPQTMVLSFTSPAWYDVTTSNPPVGLFILQQNNVNISGSFIQGFSNSAFINPVTINKTVQLNPGQSYTFKIIFQSITADIAIEIGAQEGAESFAPDTLTPSIQAIIYNN